MLGIKVDGWHDLHPLQQTHTDRDDASQLTPTYQALLRPLKWTMV